MNTPQFEHHPRTPASGRQRIAFWLLIGIAVFYLISEHRMHLAGALSWLPILFLLACPLIHLFGHGHGGGHSHHHGHREHERDSETPPEPTTRPPAERTPPSHTHRGDPS